MTSTELKQLLDSAANAMTTLKDILPPDTDQRILDFLGVIDSNTLDYLLPLVKISNPNLTKDELAKDVASITQSLTTIKQLIVSGELDKTIGICQSLENKPIILAIVSRLI